MNKHLTYILTLILLCVSGVAYGQDRCSIAGSVIDGKGEGIPYAAAVVYSGEKIVGGDVTDEKGRFRVDVQKTAGRVVLSVEFIGYRKKTIEITALEKSVNVGEIVLEEDTQQLGEAVVSASTESHKATLEKTSINASSQMTSSKGSAIDVLSSAASVTIANDVISIRGNSNILVLMDENSTEEAKNAKLLLWPGCCPIHEQLMKPSMVDEFHKHFPGCRVLVHPECSPEVVDICDGSGSTAFLIKEAEKAAEAGLEPALCIGTEFHLVHRLMERYADRINIIPLAQATCHDMEKVDEKRLLATLERLESGEGVVTVDEELKAPARDSLMRMLENCR